MAKWQLRRSKKVGPLRMNVSRRGISVSGGPKGARVSVNSRGQAHRTTSIPGLGVYKREKIRGGAAAAKRKPVAGHEISLNVVDATGGTRRLFDDEPDVETLELVGLRQHLGDVPAVAQHAGLTDDKPQAIRDLLLVQSGNEIAAYLMVTAEDNPTLFSRKENRAGIPKVVQIGRLSAKAAKRFVEYAGDADAKAVVYIDARPMRAHIEARLRPSAFEDETEADGAHAPISAEDDRPIDEPRLAPPPPPPHREPDLPSAADWYPDPWREHRVRYFDGNAWTTDVAD